MYLNWPERLQSLLPRHAMRARVNRAAGLCYFNEIFLSRLTIERLKPLKMMKQGRHCLCSIFYRAFSMRHTSSRSFCSKFFYRLFSLLLRNAEGEKDRSSKEISIETQLAFNKMIIKKRFTRVADVAAWRAVTNTRKEANDRNRRAWCIGFDSVGTCHFNRF